MQLAFFSIKLRVYGENIICISVTIIFSQLFLSTIRCTIDRSLFIIMLRRVGAVDAPYFVSTLAGRGVRIPCSNSGFLVVREQGAGHQEQLHCSPGLHSQSSEYTVKKDYDFPVPSWDVTNQVIPGQGEFGYSDIPAGDGKIDNLFYSVGNSRRPSSRTFVQN